MPEDLRQLKKELGDVLQGMQTALAEQKPLSTLREIWDNAGGVLQRMEAREETLRDEIQALGDELPPAAGDLFQKLMGIMAEGGCIPLNGPQPHFVAESR